MWDISQKDMNDLAKRPNTKRSFIMDNTNVTNVIDNQVRLVKNNTVDVDGDNKAVSGVLENSDTQVVYGTGGDLWGTTLTPTDVNNTRFGAAISFVNNSNALGNTVSVDSVQIQVHYSLGGGYRWKQCRFMNTVVASVETFNPHLHEGTVRTTCEIILGDI